MQPCRLLLDRLDTPIGCALLVTDETGHLRALDWTDFEARMRELLRRQYASVPELEAGGAPAEIRDALQAYFDGEPGTLDGIPWDTGGTRFQRTVWETLQTIPAGTTLSYGQLAERIGSPKALRAVGLANGSNPVSIVIPCHRVIGANGSLTGYGGGLARKQWLLAHEARVAEPMQRSLLIA
ncbi:MAG: methylated-DNA--[protein]-cysteine S-methyltransferase [Aquabacterium sp.]|nr:MAG: methylated-DNA--[protein]-cysteine S-methyltransferase [Aquabacterium sp.]